MRARRSERDPVSLFPFLSVLACVIGTLTLLIAALALGQVARNLMSDYAQRVRPELEAESRELARRIDTTRRKRASLEAKRAEVREWGVDPDRDRSERRTAIQARLALLEDRKRLEDLKELREALARQLAALESLPDTRAQNSDGRRLTLLPSGTGTPLTPFFVECLESAMRLHRHDEGWSIPLDPADPDDKTQFSRFLERVSLEKNGSVVFLIRPDGVATYRAALAQIRHVAVRHAKLPLPADMSIDFSRL